MVACDPDQTIIAALGSPITFAEQTSALIAEMSWQGRQAFAKHKKILMARAHIDNRLLAYATLSQESGPSCSRNMACPPANTACGEFHASSTFAGDAFPQQATY